MCYAVTAEPPNLPIQYAANLPPGIGESGGAASGERITLTSQDGTQLAAYVARAEAPNGAGIVILPDVRGLFRFYEQLAVRFAVAGVEAIVIDYFGRTAGTALRPDDFEYMPHVAQTKADQIAQDVAAAVTYLRQMPGARINAIFTAGFCFGGSNSFLQAIRHHGLAGVIGFYGNPAAPRQGGPAAVDVADKFECPVLGLFGGADQGIPASAVHAFDQALAQAGIAHELVTYPGAPHSFFDRAYEQYQSESADAWMRMLDFIGAHTPKRV